MRAKYSVKRIFVGTRRLEKVIADIILFRIKGEINPNPD